MIRLRRSRVVLFLTVTACLLLFNIYSKSHAYEWAKQYTGPRTHPVDIPAVVNKATTTTTAPVAPVQTVAQVYQNQDHHGLVLDTDEPPARPDAVRTSIAGTGTAGTTAPQTQEGPDVTSTKPATADIDRDAPGRTANDAAVTVAYVSTSTTSTTSKQHWTKQSEHFPVPTESIIALPSQKPKSLQRVQHKFKDESPTERGAREKRLAQIVKVFKKSWDGYTQRAWLHDELSPVSGKFRDPFCGWAATLVDTLDTLVIMGLDEEFQHALQGLAKIDFTWSSRRDIPLFETTIRYLGGLLSAYDLSGQQHAIILDKAVELAEILMGAFDTPNRMPKTYYQWRPEFAKQPRRADTRVVMAELGSLSMEFTRLAQITKNNKYYDAIARITDELEAYQDKTTLPGLWPVYIDASGCKKPESTHQQLSGQKPLKEHGDIVTPDSAASKAASTTAESSVPKSGNPNQDEPAPPKFDHAKGKGRIGGWDDKQADVAEGAGKVPTRHADGPLSKRQLHNIPDGLPVHSHEDVPEPAMYIGDAAVHGARVATAAGVDCVPQGLASPPGAGTEEFTFGGMADSTYEYLPKQFALLGGLVPQYRAMYEKAIEAANKWLLFRPMTPTNDDILVLGKGRASEEMLADGEGIDLVPELGHLLCFAGGMYGLGAKLFDRPEDLQLGIKMTDACVWAYSITDTGIMPEGMDLIMCNDTKACKWNQTLWEDLIDPNEQTRTENARNVASAKAARATAELSAGESNDRPSRGDVRTKYLEQKQAASGNSEVQKRQLGPVENDVKRAPKGLVGAASSNSTSVSQVAGSKSDPQSGTGDGEGMVQRIASTPTKTLDVSIEDAWTLDHSDFVKWRTRQMRLPDGVVRISGRKYLLRPEAIESVFYMYRITGDPEWREKGWKMWVAIQAATDTRYGASAIDDVTRLNTTKTDEMESFWLAETLKYFYLLFSEESVISLDDWVLNTEAHPFRRPVAA